jgi:cytochrome oxidase assembly protein ShyY1
MKFDSAWLKSSWKRWLTWLVLATIFAIACVFLSNWQFNRRAEAVARINLIAANYDQVPVALDALVDNGYSPADEWRPVSVVGRYLNESVFLVRNRPNNGNPGFIELVPFLTQDGRIIAVDRGWLPTGNTQDSPDLVPAPLGGQQTITARLRTDEPDLNRDAPKGQLPTINPKLMSAQLADESGSVETDFYVRMSSESNQASQEPDQLGKPALDEGNHLSYAIQWIVFGAMAFFALGWAIRQELIARRVATEAGFVPKRRKKVGDDDKAYEDSLISAE